MVQHTADPSAPSMLSKKLKPEREVQSRQSMLTKRSAQAFLLATPGIKLAGCVYWASSTKGAYNCPLK
eukprot:scaffold2669_cov21-Tisochrysis_lutea.AAC.3